jgi:hypothetical protein
VIIERTSCEECRERQDDKSQSKRITNMRRDASALFEQVSRQGPASADWVGKTCVHSNREADDKLRGGDWRGRNVSEGL